MNGEEIPKCALCGKPMRLNPYFGSGTAYVHQETSKFECEREDLLNNKKDYFQEISSYSVNYPDMVQECYSKEYFKKKAESEKSAITAMADENKRLKKEIEVIKGFLALQSEIATCLKFENFELQKQVNVLKSDKDKLQKLADDINLHLKNMNLI